VQPVIDSHQHFWTTARDDYGWLTPEDEVLYRDFGPEHLVPFLERAGISSTVLVQAAPSAAETRYLLGIADRTDWVAAVVGWIPLGEPKVERTLEDLAGHPNLRGIRPMLQDIPDDEWMLRDALTPGLRALVDRELSLDALVQPRHLPHLLTLMARHPELRVVIDHGAKPEIQSGRFDEWSASMTALARETSAFCKLSGLVTEAGPGWRTADLRPYVAHLLESFGPSRLMWGSDWPVVELAGGPDRWWAASGELLEGLSVDERAAILGGTARLFYRLGSK
jgi:L-fuconolactonase